MEIRQRITGRNGVEFDAVYYDADTEPDIRAAQIRAVRAYCFYNDKIVIVHESKGHWGLPGGSLEPGETITEGIRREVKEETNMRILDLRILGLQEAHEASKVSYYVRFACLVEPEGEFTNDPDGDVTEIALIDPHEVVARTDAHWKKIAERFYLRALEARAQMEQGIYAGWCDQSRRRR